MTPGAYTVVAGNRPDCYRKRRRAAWNQAARRPIMLIVRAAAPGAPPVPYGSMLAGRQDMFD